MAVGAPGSFVHWEYCDTGSFFPLESFSPFCGHLPNPCPYSPLSPPTPQYLVFFVGSLPEEISNPCSYSSPCDHQIKRLLLAAGCEDQGELVEGPANLWKGPVGTRFGFAPHMVPESPQDIVC